MGAELSEERDEAAMFTAVNQLAGKYGCKVKFDLQQHTINFNCPDKEAEVGLALELEAMFKGDR
jgi:hypothetical protein